MAKTEPMPQMCEKCWANGLVKEKGKDGCPH